MHDNRTRTIKFNLQKTSKLKRHDFIAYFEFSKLIYKNTPQCLISEELIIRAKEAMQKSCVGEILTFYDMIYMAKELINKWDAYYFCRIDGLSME